MTASANPHHYANKGNLTTGSVRRHLVRLTIPMIWAMFATISFQLVDTFFVSRLGTRALTAMSFTFPVTYGVFTLMMGVSIATSSAVSRQIGRGNWRRVRRLTTHALMIGFVFGVVIAAAGLLLLDPLFRAMGAPADLLPLIRQFMVIWFAGSIFINVPLVCNAAIRATGNSLFPAAVMTIAALANAALDPPLIFGLFGAPALGIEGAAIATVFANACALCAGLYFLAARKKMLSRNRRPFRLFGDSAKRLLVIALPVGLTSALFPVVSGVLTHWLARTGTSSVAAYGIATRVEAFIFIAVIALATGMAPVIGQNHGAGHHDRVRAALRAAFGFATIWSGIAALALELAARPVARLFSDDPAIVAACVLYFRIVPFSYLFGNLVPGWSSAFNAMGQPKRAFIMTVTRMVLLTLPLAFIGLQLYGAPGIFAAIAAANVIAGAGFHLLNRRYMGRTA